MAENNTEYLLRNINEKLKNRNAFAWKLSFGWLVAMPFLLLGAIFMGMGNDPYNQGNGFAVIGAIFGFVAFLAIVVNLILGIISLYKSTQDSEKR
jgi:cellobiose-specific phosphotransferase system component IIC